MNKRGQYFLIAAIVLVTVILSFATITNSVKKRAEKERVYELYCDINVDIKRISNYNPGLGEGVCGQLDLYCKPQMESLLGNLNEVYPGVEKKIYLITIPWKDGEVEINKIKSYVYTVEDGMNPAGNDMALEVDEENNKIIVTMEDGKIYYFYYDNTKNSYIIIIQEISDGKTQDQYVISGSSSEGS